MRRRAEIVNHLLARRLETVLPEAMRATGIDMWLVICQEDNLDPVFSTMIPMDTWCPILQILAFFDRGEGKGVERINISGTNTHDLYDRPYRGQLVSEQWPLLCQVIRERNPQKIGINIGATEWAAGGLTHNLYLQLVQKLPAEFVSRLTSAEALATHWLANLSDDEVALYEHVVRIARAIIADCYSPNAIVPWVTSAQDLEWHYWQCSADLGMELAFKPFFNIVRRQAQPARTGFSDAAIRPGDLIHCDVGIKYMRLNSDHQQWAYVLREGEHEAPAGLRNLLSQATRLQDVFMAGFQHGLTGNELLKNILSRARAEGVPNPKVYSHSLGLFLHEPGPLIGLPWEQEACPGRGDVKLEYNNCFTMELSVAAPVPEWDGQEVRFSIEEDVVFTRDGCRVIDTRQTDFYLV
jgi:hypothetical protein